MIPRRSKLRLRIAILGLVLLVINAAAFGAFTWPRVTRARDAEIRAQDVSLRRVELETLWSRVAARKSLMTQNQNDLEVLRRDLVKPRASDLLAAQRDIERMARESGLKPMKSNYAIEPVRETDFVKCVVTLLLDGSYANLTAFLTRIESAKRFIVVDQMALSQDELGASLNLKLSALFKEDGAPLASR